MSGICGILRLDGGAPAGLEAMTRKLETRGPDGTHHYRDGSMALGHALLAATPEALHEAMPLTDPATGCTITADLRIDNRDELIPALGLASETRVIGDGELVLRAWLRWGEDCPKHLLGDFAFAIWDPRKQHLFCARDHMGMKQLIWHHGQGRIFAFASEPEAVLLAEAVPKRINEGRIADFLENYLEGIDYTSTFFEGVFRLPPAHCLTVGAGGLSLRRYWTLAPGPELSLESDEAYAQAFLEVFSEAVRCRLRGNGQVGSMLSGGIDSGSVAAVAGQLLAATGAAPLLTFSAVGPDPDTCVETRTILAALTMPGVQPTLVNHAELKPYLDDLIRMTKESAEPFDGHMTLVRAMYLAAGRAGVKAVLDGVGGDVVLSSSGRLPRLIRAGYWRQAWADVRGQAHYWQVARRRVLLPAIRQAAVPDWLRGIRDRIAARQGHRPSRPLLDPDFARRIDLAARVATFRGQRSQHRLPPAIQRAEGIVHTFPVVGRERYDRVAAQSGIETRDPFMDVRVVALALRLPEAQIGGHGWHKLILRRATARLLPDPVRWRIGKEHLGGRFTQAMLVHWPGWCDIAAETRQKHRSLRLNLDGNTGLENRKMIAETLDMETLWLSVWLQRLSAKG